MLRLYAHPHSPYSLRVQWFLEEIAVPYAYEAIDLEQGEHFAGPYGLINPLQRVPAITYQGFSLGESNAILRYLSERFERFDWYPRNLEERAVIDQWMDYGSFHAGGPITNLAWQRHWLPKFHRQIDAHEVVKALAKVQRELPLVEDYLQGRRYLAGACPTLADIALLPLVSNANAAEVSLSPYPNLMAWCERLYQRAAWVKVSEKLTSGASLMSIT